MRRTRVKSNAGSFKKLWAFFTVAVLTAFLVGFGSSAQAVISSGINYKIYTGYGSSTGVRPMDNPAVVSNYTLCKTGTIANIYDLNPIMSGCGSDYFLVRYQGYIYSPVAQTLYFRGYSDDGFWARVGGNVVVNNWALQGCSGSSTGVGVTFAAGEYKAIDAWFFEHGGGECSQLYYANNSSFSGETLVPASMFTTNNYADVSFNDTTIDAQVVQGGNYSQAVGAIASGTISYAVNSGSLPPGVSLNSTTGALTGTATTAGLYSFNIRATANDAGVVSTADTGTLTITVGTNTGLTEPLSNETLWIGEAFSDRAIYSGYPTPSVSKLSGTLPPGLSLSSNGTLSGTPTTSGTYTFKLRGTNFVDSTDSATYTYTIEAAPTFTANGNYSRTVEYGDAISDIPTVSGNEVSFSLSGELPAGLSVDTNSGAVLGNANEAGQFVFRVLASNRSGSTYSTQSTITVNQTPVFTSSSVATSLTKGTEYSYNFEATGYPAPTFDTGGTALPAGLTLSSDGHLSGTPTAGRSYTFSVRAYNWYAGAWHIATISKTINVEAGPVFTAGENYTATVTLGNLYTHTPTVSGNGVSFALGANSDLPAGVSLDSESGVLTGRPTEAGEFTFTVVATNSLGTDTSSVSKLNVRAAPAFTLSAPLARLNKDVAYSYEFAASGFPTPTFSVVSGRLPHGLTLDSDGTLHGTPTTGDEYTFTIRASNALDTVDITKTIEVIQAPYAIDDVLQLLILAGGNYADAVHFGGYPEPTYEITDGVLPPGLSLNSLSGAITGTVTTGGLYNFKVRVTSGDSSTTTANYGLIVNQAPQKFEDAISPTTELGKAFADGVSTTGYPIPTYSLKSGALPIGLKLNATTGAITGTTTSTGVYNFVIEALNTVGALALPGSITVQQTPVFLRGELPAKLNVGDKVSAKLTATGFPSPTYAVTSGALPEGLSLDANTGEISGVVTNGGMYGFVVSAINEVGATAYRPITVEVIGAETAISVAAKIGEVITGAPVSIESGGLKAAAPYDVVLRSTPQTIANGKTSAQGTVEEQTKIPAGLEPGWHSITLTSLKSDGTEFQKAIYFQVTETLMLEEISPVAPSEAQKQEALVNDPEFYARMGIDPAGTVTPEAAAEQVEQVTSVVASVALVSAAAAGAAAAASAAGGAASAAGGGSSGGGARAGGGSSGGGSSSSARASGGGTTSSGSSSGGSGGTSGGADSSEESESADYGNLEADHDDFEKEGSGVIDRLPIWKLGALTVLDNPLTRWIESSAKVSPVLSRILNDGTYLRALFGSFVGLSYLVAVTMGVAAVDTSADSLAVSGRVAILVAIMALGTLDALFGIVAMSAFVVTSLVTMPLAGIGDVRYLLAMFILGFAPSIMATTFRKIRRPAIENIHDAWERIVDLALIGFISVLTVMSLVGSVSAFAGATVPLSADVKPIAFAIASVALIRVLVEEGAAKFAPDRLNRLNPTEVPGTFDWQPWASLVLKASVLVVMIGGMVGMGWHLWVGTFLIFLPGLIGMVFPQLPSFKWIHEFIPGGVGALAFATLISSWSGQLVNALLGKSELYGQLSFILIPLPVILISIIGMFAQAEDKLWQRTGKKWVYIAGGIAVFVFTIQVTEFFPTIFG